MDVQFSPQSPMMADYLRHLFPPDADGNLQVKSTNDVGRLIISFCRTSLLPVRSDDPASLTLTLPRNAITQGLVNKFLYIPAHDQARINLAAQAVFNIDFAHFMQRGEAAGFKKAELIEAFIASRGLVTSDNFETLHKKEFRLMQRQKKMLFRKLYRKSFYIEECLDFSVNPKKHKP